MKNLIFIINALFVMATSTLLFSCGGDDDPVPQKEEETPIVNVPFYTAALDSQLLFLDQKYEFVIDGVAKTLTFSDMTMSNESAVKENIDKAFRILDGTKVRPQYSIYKAIFPVKKGHTVTFVGYAYSAKSNIPENVELVNVLLYYQLSDHITQHPDCSELGYHKEVYVSSLDSLCKIVNKAKNVSCVAQ